MDVALESDLLYYVPCSKLPTPVELRGCYVRKIGNGSFYFGAFFGGRGANKSLSYFNIWTKHQGPDFGYLFDFSEALAIRNCLRECGLHRHGFFRWRSTIKLKMKKEKKFFAELSFMDVTELFEILTDMITFCRVRSLAPFY